MLIQRQRGLGVLAISIAGALLGAILCYWLGRVLLLRAAIFELSEYAQALTRQADSLANETNLAFDQLNASDLPYCSQQEINILLTQTFRSRDLKDIGRTRDGRLYCSASLGNLAHPFSEGAPSLIMADGTNVYTNVAVILSASRGDRATVIESGGVNAVLNPNAFDRWDRPHTGYMVALVNRKSGQIAVIAGTGAGSGLGGKSGFSIDPAWVVSPGLRNSGGILYSSQCSQLHEVCAVTTESVADIWGWSRATQTAYTSLGVLIGFGFGLILALLWQRSANLNRQLHRAIKRNSDSLSLAYQPIVDIVSGNCVGAEALLRWTDQDGSSISPDIFVALAEDAGFIGDLTALVVRKAMQEMGALLHANPEMTLSINVAASDLQGRLLDADLEKHVLQAGIHPRQITLELTERSTADMQAVSTAIKRLSRIGYKIHIDDFGTGFSSLSYINQLSVNAIKVDGAFTRVIGTDAVTASILPQILAMAETLKVDVIVEGVETQAQADYILSTHNPPKAQGWFFSYPLSAPALSEFVARSAARSKASLDATLREIETISKL